MRNIKRGLQETNKDLLITDPPLTYSGLQESRYQSPRGLLGAGEDGEGGHQQGQHRVTRHDDRVGRHTARPREPVSRSLIREIQ